MVRSAGCAVRFLITAACALASFAPAEGQWRLDAQAGRLEYHAAPDLVSTTMALGLTRAARASTLGISIGVPFSREEPAWGALDGYRRFSISPSSSGTGVALDVAGNAFGYRVAAPDSVSLPLLDAGDGPESGGGLGAEIAPLVFWQSASASAELRTGLIGFRSFGDAGAYERLAFAADAVVELFPLAGLGTRVEGRWVRADEGGFPFAGVGLTYTRGATVWASVGRWIDDVVDELSWDAGVAVPLGDRAAVSLSGRHEPLDPVYATPSRTSWGAGVSLWLGAATRSVPEPVPAAYEDGLATIVLAEADVEGTPSIAGDFNGWTPTPMERAGDSWVHRIALEPGVYNYAFVDASGNWFVPAGTPGRRSDGMGGHVAVLVVNAE